MNMKELWDMGYSDEGIAAHVRTTRETVRKWRVKHKLDENKGQRREKSELALLLPELWETIQIRPSMDGVPAGDPLEATVIHVNREHLHYTVQFKEFPWLKESYRVI